jgi:hypothetical protein
MDAGHHRGQVDYELVGPGRREGLTGLLVGIGDDEHLGMGQQGNGRLAHQRRDVRDLLLDVATIGAA